MILIIGAGISGLTAARHLTGERLILEKKPVAGGLATEYNANGYWFPYGGHYFHFQGKEKIRNELETIQPFHRCRRNSKVLLAGRFIPFPLQFHLGYLPGDLRRAILAEMLQPRSLAASAAGLDLESFLIHHFGPKLTDLFFRPFQAKFWRQPMNGLLANMDKGSIPIPDRDSVLAGSSQGRQGSRGRRFPDVGYNPVFHYPRPSLKGFIDGYSRPVFGRIRFNETVKAIDSRKKEVVTANGRFAYDHLISTVPLPDLLGMLTPPETAPAPAELRHISTLVANLVLKTRRRRFHWLYLPEKELPFYRAGYYPAKDRPLVYLEKTVAAGQGTDLKTALPEIILTLKKTGMIKEKTELLHADLTVIPVSYVIFDRKWPRLVPPVLERLRRKQIYSIGRYGSWNYTAMSDDILAAETLAKELNGR